VIALAKDAALETLGIALDKDASEPQIATLCLDTVAMLEDNSSLECLDVQNDGVSHVVYLTALAKMRRNSTLKRLWLHPNLKSFGEMR
jgi:hypothetical protein